MSAQNRRRKRKRKIIRLAAAAALLLLIAALLLLFQVKKVKVYGNTRHTSAEITSGLMDDLLTRNTLYLTWKYRDGEIPDTLPFLDSLHVQLKSPSRVDIHVTEKEVVACIEKGQRIYFDRDGTVLEISDEAYEGVPVVTGAVMDDAVLYQKLPMQSSAQLRTILSLTQLLLYHGMTAQEIRFGDNMEITIFIGNIEVQLGQDEYLEEKIANLNKILPSIEGKSGTLHLESFTGRNEQIPFTPDGAGVQEGDDASADGGDGSEIGEDGSADGEDGSAVGEDGSGTGEDGSADGEDGPEDGEDNSSPVIPMVFDSSGTLIYNVRIVNGTVVDEYGNPVPGVTVNEDGNVVDAYMNVIDPNTGDLLS